MEQHTGAQANNPPASSIRLRFAGQDRQHQHLCNVLDMVKGMVETEPKRQK